MARTQDRIQAALRRVKYLLRVAVLDANFFNPDGFERGEVSFEVRSGAFRRSRARVYSP